MMGIEVTSWSPDGRYLAVGGRGAAIGGAPRLYIYGYNGTSWTTLTYGWTNFGDTVEDISWSPDGKYIAVAGRGTKGEYWEAESLVQIFSFNGSSLTLLDEFHPPGEVFNSVSWNPAGDVICLGGECANQDVYLRGFDGTNLTTYNYGLRREYIPITNSSSFDPTGQYIATVGNYDGYELEVLRYNGMYNYPTLIASADFGEGARYVTWMDDGNHLIVGGKNGTNDLVIYSFDGSILTGLQEYDHGNHTNVIDIHERFVAVGGDKDPDDLRVYAFNIGPIAQNDSITLEEDTEIMISVLENDVDPDGDDIFVTNITTSRNGSVSISLDNRSIRYLPDPDWYGNDSFNYTISDIYGLSANATVNVTVMNTNDPPSIITANIEEVLEDSQYLVQYEAADKDPEDVLRWTMNTKAGFLHLNETTGSLSGSPKNDDVGVYFINVSVTDLEGSSDSSNFTLEVININDAPEIPQQLIMNATEDVYFSFDLEANDVDIGDELKWSLHTDAKWLSIVPSTGSLTGLPSNSEVGSYFVNATVEDISKESDHYNFTLFVMNVNDPPEIITIDVITIRENETYSVDYDAEDIDPTDDTLVWDFKTNASSWLNMDPVDGVLSGKPTFEDSGTYWINISVRDGNGGIDWSNFTLFVEDVHYPEPGSEPVNSPPLLSEGGIEPGSGNTSTEFIFVVHYKDIDGDAPTRLVVIINGTPFDMTFESGELSDGFYVHSTQLEPGEHHYYFNGSDGKLFAISDDGTPVTQGSALSISVVEIEDDGDDDDVVPADDDEPIDVNDDEGNLAWIIWLVFFVSTLLFVCIVMFISGKDEEDAEEE
ncbi:MAG: Ig-like domain-containing protein [Thermoplasmatota archaeon]